VAGTFERYRLEEWLTFISSELHKMFSPWLFHPEHGELAQRAAREKIAPFIDRSLTGQNFLMGDRFTAADAYCFTVGWSKFARIDMAAYPNLRRYMDRIATRPKVREAMRAEGMLVPSEA
jgi:glutathione S-transferase